MCLDIEPDLIHGAFIVCPGRLQAVGYHVPVETAYHISKYGYMQTKSGEYIPKYDTRMSLKCEKADYSVENIGRESQLRNPFLGFQKVLSFKNDQVHIRNDFSHFY